MEFVGTLKGAKGEQGIMGLKGEQGKQGPRGEQVKTLIQTVSDYP